MWLCPPSTQDSHTLRGRTPPNPRGPALAAVSARRRAPFPGVIRENPGADPLELNYMRKAMRKAMRKGGKKGKAMKGMKRRAMRKKKAAAPEEAPMKAMRRK